MDPSQLLFLAPGDAATSGIDVVSIFAQYGVLGIFCLGFAWFARGAHQRERDRADRDRADRDRMEEENRRLNMMILDRVFPAMAAATKAAEDTAKMINEIQRERDRERRTAKGGE